MPAQQNSNLVISNLRGGQNDTDPPNALSDDQVVLAQNIEFFSSMLGERRNGCGPISVAGSTLATTTTIAHLSQWFPTNNVLVPEFIAMGVIPSVSTVISKRTAGIWTDITPIDTPYTSAPDVYEMVAQSLNGKDFMAYRSGVERLHVWDGTNWRRTGLAEPGLINAVSEGVGTFTGDRYYRIRYITVSGSDILRRSEPGPSRVFNPGGTGAGAAVTRPVLINEGETHWELEASLDNATFYRIETTAVGTATVNDEVPYVDGYADEGPLSEDIGDYDLQPSARFLTVDGDRLIGAGHWTDASLQSEIWWSPVSNDPGVGNDERLPLSINNRISLDNYDGGPITGIASANNGTWYAFKWDGIYKMVRTGDIAQAYDVITISKTRGAIPGSIVAGYDESGSSCIYFLDPNAGPSRIGSFGLQTIVGLRNTWARVNLQAGSVVARGCFYPFKQQLHWWIAVDGNDRPGLKLVLQVSEIAPQQGAGGNGVGRGWSIATGRIAEATAVSVFTELVSINGISQVSERPFIGLTSPDYIQRCDTEVTDAGVAYTAILRTKPYMVTGLLNRWGAMNASLLAYATSVSNVIIKFIRDMSLETNQITTGMAPVGTETLVVKDFDDLRMSEARLIQVEIRDA